MVFSFDLANMDDTQPKHFPGIPFSDVLDCLMEGIVSPFILGDEHISFPDGFLNGGEDPLLFLGEVEILAHSEILIHDIYN